MDAAHNDPFHDLGLNRPAHQGRQASQAVRRMATSCFLLGMGPLPPPRPEQLAANFAMAGLDGRLPPYQAQGYEGQQGPSNNSRPSVQAALSDAAQGAPELGNYYRAVEPGTSPQP